MTTPAVYRRRADLIEAIQVSRANVADLAELVRGRVDWIRERPLLFVPGSVQPARLGDWVARDLTRDQPWYPIRELAFSDMYEPAQCSTCRNAAT